VYFAAKEKNRACYKENYLLYGINGILFKDINTLREELGKELGMVLF